jgi:peptidoglycan/LPS O-acetylase OafA/YrhL
MQRPSLGDRAGGRLNHFDFLRFALAALVILSHSYPLLRGNNDTEPLSVATGGQLTFGELAVNCFFSLSGFLITQSWLRSRGPVDYLRKRVLRIYPGFIVTCLISGLLIAPAVAVPRGQFWQEFSPLKFLLFQLVVLKLVLPRGVTYFPETPLRAINGSLWSIPYEFLCYLGVALLGMLGGFRRRWTILAVCLALCVLQALHVWLGFSPTVNLRLEFFVGTPRVWFRVGSCFAAGAAFYMYRDRIPYSGRWFLAALVLLVAAGLWWEARLLPVVFPLLGTYVLLYVAFQQSPLNGFGRHGDFSYGLYLYAFPIQQMLVQNLGRSTHPLVLAALAFPLTLLAAFLSWHIVERPFLRLKKARARHEPMPAIVAEPGAVA